MDQDFPDGDFPSGSETELQRRVAEGAKPRTILEELWQTMQPRLYGYGCKRLGDTSQADDFVQKVFLKMQVNFARMIAREPVEAWIFTVARNEIVDWYRERAKSDVPAEAELLDRDSAEESWRIPFEEQIETRIGDIRPLYAYLRAILARGWLRDDDLRAYWQGIVEEVPQRTLAQEFGVTQGRISQLKSEVGQKVRIALYLSEILGLVKAPQREAEIRSHLELLDLAAALTAADRALLRHAGGAVRRDPLGQPYLL
ncbi:MAG TPA: sigma-70 family RNA polymerase sigma factor, partial [Streptosporangiaceae bacterium]|nr:sigma-70 family RNA polymerase sigma factor [Streptosporangiaceae bacterium]